MKHPRQCIIFAPVNGQNAGGPWKQNHALSCYSYLIPDNIALKDVVVFECVDSMQRYAHNKSEAVLVDLDFLYMFDDEQCDTDTTYEYTVTVDMGGE